ncbi:MAG: RNA polymerase sigma factor [Phycisphaerales bacterium]|nr:MAG: RNA polymerase sigma factor [Phycisphaerales bacterium]
MGKTKDQLIDEILVMDCQSGRVKAMEVLVSRWQKRLWRYAYRLTGDSGAAWDVTQESWLSIIRGIRRLNDPARFKAWVYRIVTNKVNDWIRKSKALPRCEAGTIDQEQTVQEQVRSDSTSDLHIIMRRLPAQHRTILSLYHLEGLGIAEVARVLQIPTGTVKSRLHKARRQLKKLWQECVEN